VADFALQFSSVEVPELASRFSYADDSGCRAAGSAARNRGHYSREEFLLVCKWKTDRSRRKAEDNTAREIEEATALALSSRDEAVRMQALMGLNGVGVPTASALLYFAFPSDYPILDVRALDSLGHSEKRTTYPVAFWLDYLGACRSLARDLGVSIRTLDKALWQHSKEARG
jgi:hypothetical protein